MEKEEEKVEEEVEEAYEEEGEEEGKDEGKEEGEEEKHLLLYKHALAASLLHDHSVLNWDSIVNWDGRVWETGRTSKTCSSRCIIGCAVQDLRCEGWGLCRGDSGGCVVCACDL